MNNDLESQILEFVPASNHVFSTNDIILSTGTGSQGQVTSWIPGRIKQVVVANGGSGYLSGDTITISSLAVVVHRQLVLLLSMVDRLLV
ncbi:MAG: hypothetical protein CM15mV5_2550 [uncultured marine virus]|nr:MAG: hypothetical protein CM15mV5_2550 [uncultured marine virus]